MDRSSLIDAGKAFLRAWIVSTIMLWIPGLFGWVNEVSEWADQKGAPPFPDPSNLAFLFVAALTAAFPAAGMAIVRLIENAAGVAILPRPAGPQALSGFRRRGERGAALPLTLIGAGVAVLGLVILFATTADPVGWVMIVVGVAVLVYDMVANRPTRRV